MFQKFLFGFGAAVAAVAFLATAVEAQIVTLPTGLGPGEEYRLVFFTSTSTAATSTDIADYNAFVTAAATAVPELNALGTTWSALASTATTDARDNIASAPFTSIYRLDDLKVADDDDDLWDGVGAFGDQLLNAINVNELGTTVNLGYNWTGTLLDGTKGVGSPGGPLGSVTTFPVVGDNSVTNWTWIDAGNPHGPTGLNPLYAISDVLTAPGVVPVPDITSVPTDLRHGEEYRLVFSTSIQRTATSSDIADYNTFGTNVANTVQELEDLGTTWKVIGSTAAVDAKDNIGTAAGVPIYRLDGNKVADDDADLWDGDGWTDRLLLPIGINEKGTAVSDGMVWTGTDHDGTAGLGPLGSDSPDPFPRYGSPTIASWSWISEGNPHGPTAPHPVYVISDVLIAWPNLFGDLDGNGYVDSADLDIITNNWGQSVTPGDPLLGDPSGDGVVAGADFDLVMDQWHQGVSPVAAGVPEPGSLAMLTLGGLVLLMGMWPRKTSIILDSPSPG